MGKRRVGIVGYGHLGKYLAEAILHDATASAQLELAFVWNRTADKIGPEIPRDLVLTDLNDFVSREADLIVEVAHPNITAEFGARFLAAADYFIGSPTALAKAEVERALRAVAEAPGSKHGVYVPAGALWGAQDIQKMAARGSLKGLTITMKKAPHHLKVEPPLAERVAAAESVQDETIVFSGTVRELCPLAPNNVNTMAAAAIAAFNLGFDGVKAILVADPRLERHIVEVDVRGPGSPENGFRVITERSNPAEKGAVTGTATFASFLSSMLLAGGRGGGMHLC